MHGVCVKYIYIYSAQFIPLKQKPLDRKVFKFRGEIYLNIQVMFLGQFKFSSSQKIFAPSEVRMSRSTILLQQMTLCRDSSDRWRLRYDVLPHAE